MKLILSFLLATAGSLLTTIHAAPARGGKICNILDFGAKAGNKTDCSPAIQAAFDHCVKPNQPNHPTLLIPKGTYLIRSNLHFNGAGWTFNMEGNLVVAFDPRLGGNMLGFSHVSDFEFKGHGSIDGQGRLWSVNGNWDFYPSRPRILRFDPIDNARIHDVRLFDAPMFHLTVLGNNTEVYNIRIHGEDHGATDGIDIGGWNNHVHNVHVTNRDECVTVKSPSSNILIEDIFCDNSGATNIGSIGKGGGSAFIENIVIRNSYYFKSEWGVGIKSFPCGNGIVRNITWENLVMDQVVYPIDIDMFWQPCGNGMANGNLKIKDINIRNVRGTSATKRPSIKFDCLPNSPCENIVVADSQIWRDDGSPAYYECNYSGGRGACLGQPNKAITQRFKPTMMNMPKHAKPPSGFYNHDTGKLGHY